MKTKELVRTAREMGAAAVALTDHGVLTGVFEFMKACAGEKDAEGEYTIPPIKGIPGVEAYFIPDRENEDAKTKRRHLLLLAKDADGYYAIRKAVTESNTLMDKGGFPRMDYALLEKHFGPGSRGHGHVIATSACMHGVLARVLLSDEAATLDVERLRKKQKDCHPVDDEYLDLCKEKDEREEKLASLIKQRDELSAITKVNINAMIRKLKSLEKGGSTSESEQLARQIRKAQEDKNSAAAKLEKIKAELADEKKTQSLFNQRFKAMDGQVEKWMAYEKDIEAVLASAPSEAEVFEEAKSDMLRFAGIFGASHFFVEVQYHGITQEARCMPLLVKLAREAGIPLVASNDAHYARKEDAHAREIISALRFNRLITEEKAPGYDQMYLKTDEELESSLLEILDKAAVDEAMGNISAIIEMCDVSMEHGTHYPKFKGGEAGESTKARLGRLAEDGVDWRYPDPASWTKEHCERMKYELDIIDRAGYNDYLCIVQDDLDYGRKYALDNEDGVGYGVGPGRGSAVGSLVCYLSGITSVDPIEYGLLFERFLNLDRVSQPDIDSDFHTEFRAAVLENVRRKHGENAVAAIITKGTMAARGSIRNVGRVTGVPPSTVEQVARMIPGGPNVTLESLPADLQKLYDYDPVVRRLIDDARLVEGTVINFSTHAAGVIISDNDDVSEYVPLMYSRDKDQWVVQCDMNECEEIGLLKMDFLGLRNIDIIDDTQHRVYRNRGICLDIEKAPLEADVFEQVFAAGKTNCIFQFESGGMREMLKKFRPSSMHDLILLVAAYRPGPMQYLEGIINVKHGRAVPEYIVPQLRPILEPTYGKPIYQEQVMQIFNKVAGFSLGEADIIRRAMSKKKMSILTNPKTNYKGRFIDGLMGLGATGPQAEGFWEELLDFANYAFNKSHAAAYAKVSYMTAYLKHHYPAEYMCSVMMRSDRDKLPMLLAECQSLGLTVQGPDICKSDAHFVNDGNAIIFGFGDIKNVGNSGPGIVSERKSGGRFRSFKDFLNRVIAGKAGNSILDKTAIESLIRSGALDCFCGGNREALLGSSEKLSEDIKKRKDKEYELSLLLEEPDNPELSAKETKSLQRRIDSRKATIAQLTSDISSAMLYTTIPENRRQKLDAEKELLGFYVSGHPLDDYAAAILEEKASDLSEVTEGNCKVCGLITELRVRPRKKDGAPLAFFKLVDRTGEIEIKCWTKEYAKYKKLIEEDAVVSITGVLRYTKECDDEGQEIVVDSGITVKTLKQLTLPDFTQVMISVPFITDWSDSVQEQALRYEKADGCELIVHDQLQEEMRLATFRVSPDILSARIAGATIAKI